MHKVLQRLGIIKDPDKAVFITIDVGFNTGLAVTRDGDIAETFLIKERTVTKTKDVATRIHGMCSDLHDWIYQMKRNYNITLAFIEGVQIYSSSMKSMASASSGDTIGLAYMAGAYMEICNRFGIIPYIVNPRDWKGSMNKDIVHARILRATGTKFQEHVADAVGMSLAVRGRL